MGKTGIGAAVFGLSMVWLLQAAEPVAVWTLDPAQALMHGPTYGDRNDPSAALRLIGARNGTFSGAVAVHFAEPTEGFVAEATALQLRGGTATIPRSAVSLRYGLPTGVPDRASAKKGHSYFDALADAPRTEAATRLVWATVRVPADAAPGDYEGTLTVAGRAVPLLLTVCDWTLPNPADFIAWADFIQSPESVALQYDVPLWSDRHFELIGKSFDQLGRAGNKTMYLMLTGHTNLGNAETMVRWIRDGETRPGGPPKFRHDFSAIEKYADLYVERIGKPAIVILYLYEGFVGGGQGSPKDPKARGYSNRGAYVTLLDPATGTVELFEGPTHHHGNQAFPNFPEDTMAFWKPVIDGVRERLNARGIPEESLCFGLCPDLMPGPRTFEYLKEVAPGIEWAEQGHGRRGRLRSGRVRYGTIVWGAHMAVDSPEKRSRAWDRKPGQLIAAHFDRDVWRLNFEEILAHSRILGERNITGQQVGFGRMSADFWPVLKDARGRTRSISFRYPLSDWAQLNLRMTPYLHPGPDGALSTIRFEMLCEGLQECEARIFIEKALMDNERKALLGAELAEKVQGILDERTRNIRDGAFLRKSDETDSPAYDWAARSKALFDAAGEVARALSP